MELVVSLLVVGFEPPLPTIELPDGKVKVVLPTNLFPMLLVQDSSIMIIVVLVVLVDNMVS